MFVYSPVRPELAAKDQIPATNDREQSNDKTHRCEDAANEPDVSNNRPHEEEQYEAHHEKGCAGSFESRHERIIPLNTIL